MKTSRSDEASRDYLILEEQKQQIYRKEEFVRTHIRLYIYIYMYLNFVMPQILTSLKRVGIGKRVRCSLVTSIGDASYSRGGRRVCTSAGLINLARGRLSKLSVLFGSSHVWMTMDGALEPCSLENNWWAWSKHEPNPFSKSVSSASIEDDLLGCSWAIAAMRLRSTTGGSSIFCSQPTGGLGGGEIRKSFCGSGGRRYVSALAPRKRIG